MFDVDDGLTDNDVIVSQIDNEGRVWFSPFNGTLCIYKDGAIQNASNNKMLAKIDSHLIKSDFVAFGNSDSGFNSFSSRGENKFFVVDKDSVRIYQPRDTKVASINQVGGRFYASSRKVFMVWIKMAKLFPRIARDLVLLLLSFWRFLLLRGIYRKEGL